MKKISYFVVALLLISSFAAIGIGKKADVSKTTIRKNTSILKQFSEPEILQTNIKTETYTEVILGSTGFLNNAGKPILPVSRTTLTVPFGTKILNAECKTDEIKIMSVTNKILPAPQPMITGMENQEVVYSMDETVYNSEEFYPNNWYKITTGAGLDENNEHVTFVNIQLYPARYSPMTNTIEYTENLEVKITYEETLTSPFPATSSYDLAIIAPSAFSSYLRSFIMHKNKYCVKTTLKTLEDIYSEYEGVDKPEQIKYFIKDAIETWGIKYVLLVGGMTSLITGQSRDDKNQGTKDWWLPVRYTNNKEMMGSIYDPGFLSDLYYADIYEGGGGFSSWDKDRYGESDGIFANWKSFGSQRDVLDFYPDVMVGRLACRNTVEVQGVTKKIIDYERLKHKSNWFDNMVLIGGDSHDDSGTDYLEGEVACDYALENYMTEFNPIKLYASNKEIDMNMVPSPEAIQREITAGAGHVLFEGHGHPGSWNTHWFGIFNWGDTPGGITVAEFSSLKNKEKLPVVVIGGCHNGQFNVTLTATTLDEPFMWTHGMPVAECFAWHLVRMTGGGSIASFGNTGLGYGNVGNNKDLDGNGVDDPDTVEGLGGYQIQMFYKTIKELKELEEEDEDEEYLLGDMWKGSINKYLDTYPGMDDQTDAKTVQQWPILGDPSLRIGGYKADGKARNIPRSFERFPLIARLLEVPIFQKIIEKI